MPSITSMSCSSVASSLKLMSALLMRYSPGRRGQARRGSETGLRRGGAARSPRLRVETAVRDAAAGPRTEDGADHVNVEVRERHGGGHVDAALVLLLKGNLRRLLVEPDAKALELFLQGGPGRRARGGDS